MSRGGGHSGFLDAGLAKELELRVQGDPLPRGNKVGGGRGWHPPPASVHAQAHRPVQAYMRAYTTRNKADAFSAYYCPPILQSMVVRSIL